jgi:hypothetical protein
MSSASVAAALRLLDDPKPSGQAESPARHMASTVRALDATRDLIIALRLCHKALNRARGEVDENAYELVTRMAQHLYCMSALATQMKEGVDRCAQERAAFWNGRRQNGRG